ncbi:Uncharacterized integral membrane protein (DUF2301) [Musa troglodytarum]|uniref:Uncharacterized integral membrane protein (DUF2301) n=2 Tax=Musa troglodytarum TaxID=320322 RepID=A0A9E7K832_9LILI|nr:Uncharacterized integral membrane protein (DUF2301) [Musa troglodytarum]
MAMAAIMASVPLSSSALLAPTSLPPPKRSSLPRNSCSIAPHLVSSSSSSCSRKLSSYSASTSYLSSGQIGSVRCRATGEGSPPTFDDRLVYQGVYGPWTLPGPNDQVQPVPTQEKLKQLIPVLIVGVAHTVMWKQYWFSAELVRTNQYHCRKRRKEEEGGKGRKKRRKKKVEDEGGKMWCLMHALSKTLTTRLHVRPVLRTKMVMGFGENTTKCNIDYEKIVNDICYVIEFTSKDVSLDVDHYRTPKLMPLSHVLATKLVVCLIEVRMNIIYPLLWLNGKTKNNYSVVVHIRVHTILISIEHDETIINDKITADYQAYHLEAITK